MQSIEIEGHKVFGDEKSINLLEKYLKKAGAKFISNNDKTIYLNNKKIVGEKQAVEKLEKLLIKFGAKTEL
jgi:hypothetical protein